VPFENGDEALEALLEQLKIVDKNPRSVIKILKSLPAEELLNVANEMKKVSTVCTHD